MTDLLIFNRPVATRDRDPESPLTRPLRETEALTLNHHQNVFSFRFALDDYRDPEKNRFVYKLEGLGLDWTETGARSRLATYIRLDPGRYVFRVKGIGPDGAWSEPTELAVRILPPPWQTWWALSLYVLASTALVFAYLRAQRNKLERERRIVQKLTEIDNLKDEFLANTSHELRTPLNGIIGLAESLIDGATGSLPDETRHNLSMIVFSGKRLASLVNDILDFSRLRNKEIQLDRRAVSLRACAQMVLTLSRPLVQDKKLELIDAIPNDIPLVEADENRLSQILHNLIGNAIKFTDAGRIEVTAITSGGFVEVRVRDTGQGIPHEHQERIFGSFEQGKASLSRSYGGTGLGLAVSKRLVELHGGRIGVESVPGEGSIFFFTLPSIKGDPEEFEYQQRIDDIKDPPDQGWLK